MEKRYSFSEALIMLKDQRRVARNGWNGKGMYVFLVKGESVTEQINDCYGDPHRYERDYTGYERGVTLPVRDALYMKTADGQLVPWVASQSDILADDWQIA